MAALGLPTALKNHTADVNGDSYYTIATDPAKRAADSLTLDDNEKDEMSSTSDSKRARCTTATPAAASERKGKIRVMNDYCCEYPLWGDVDGVQLSHRLEKDLRSLARRFNAHFDHERGWDCAERAVRHREHAQSVHRKVQAALPEYEVELDMWEVEGEGE